MDAKPYVPGHETDLRVLSIITTAPQDRHGSAVLGTQPYDQRKFPTTYGYFAQTKRTMTFPSYARYCPYDKKRIWFDARTGNPSTFVTDDREGNPFHQSESFFGWAIRKPGVE